MRSLSGRHGGAGPDPVPAPGQAGEPGHAPTLSGLLGAAPVPTMLMWVRNRPHGTPSVWLLNQVLVAVSVFAGSTRRSLKPSCLCSARLASTVATTAPGGDPRSPGGAGRCPSLPGLTLLLSHVPSCSPDLRSCNSLRSCLPLMWGRVWYGGDLCIQIVWCQCPWDPLFPGHLHALGAFHTPGPLWVFSRSALCS